MDSIKLKHVSSVISYISSFFCSFYNFLITSESYPTVWKKSFIVPLLKKPRPSSVNDVRPITNICHCAKPLDSLIASQMCNYFEKNNFYSSSQSGYRVGFSTQTVLAKLLNDARVAISQNKVTVLILYDFSKAFNSVDHFLLLRLLRSLGFSDSAMRFLFAYLSDRLMYTSESDTYSTTCGVGQGSGPGGHLFRIFINALISLFVF